jgi:hypothetical protein
LDTSGLQKCDTYKILDASHISIFFVSLRSFLK